MKNTPTGYIDTPRQPLLPAKKRWLRKKQCRHRKTASVHRNLSLRRKKLPFIREATPSARHSPQKRRTADISRPLRPHNNTKGAFAGSAFSEKTAPHQNGLASLLRPPSVFPKKLCRTKAAEDNPCPRREKQSPAWDPGRQNIRANDKETAARHQNTRSAA